MMVLMSLIASNPLHAIWLFHLGDPKKHVGRRQPAKIARHIRDVSHHQLGCPHAEENRSAIIGYAVRGSYITNYIHYIEYEDGESKN